MLERISEGDWEKFKPLRTQALDRFCERVLTAMVAQAGASTQSNHERYLAIYRLMIERDKEIDRIFDSLRRSTAIQQLANMRHSELISDEELAMFSEATRAEVAKYHGFWQQP
jgi:hypothetical protein